MANTIMPACVLRPSGDGYPDMLVGELSFSWKVTGICGSQDMYRLQVGTALNGAGDMWETGWVKSQVSAGVAYQGKPLESNRVYFAQVSVKTNEGLEISGEPVRFETGYMSADEWSADWLCSPYALSSAASPVFRKPFSIDKPIRRSRLFICGLGYYELYVNGDKISDRYMDPAWTDYSKRVCYVAHDVTKYLITGENALGVWLGAGWYANHEAKPRPTFIAQLMLEYDDGTSECMPTRAGDGWLTQKHSPMLKNTLYVGEVYDARLEAQGFSEPSFAYKPGEWSPALEAEPPKGRLVPMRAEPIRVVREMPVLKMTQPRPGVYVLDFGQNMAAILRCRFEGLLAGTRVVIRYAEILDKDGMLNTENLRTAQQRDEYIAKGGEEVYQSRFTYHGFRYAEITGLTSLDTASITALVIRNDVSVRSEFSTSNDLINGIQRICVWTENDNMHSVPTDCPQRDERLGWLNDLTVRLEEAIYNFEIDAFLQKFLVDIMDAQGEKTGAITDTVPYNRYGGQPADPVCSSYLLLPWLLYQHYGDIALLARAYPGVKAWTDYLARQRVNGIVPYSYYGDWAAPIGGNIAGSVGSGAVSAITPGTLMSTGFLYMNCILMSNMAKSLGKSEDEAIYKTLATDTSQALNRHFLDRDKGRYASGSQAANTFMLYLGVVPDEYRARVLDSLLFDIKAHDTHTTTGNLCSRYILDVLADNGRIDTAFAIITQTTYPSWGYMLSRGATTTWERWEYVDSGELIGMASHNHPMYATISGWFYKYLAGFRPLEAGFASFELRPFFPRELQSARAKVKTVKGDASISWTKDGHTVKAEVAVPFNSRCVFTITIPGAAEVIVDGREVQPYETKGLPSVTLSSGEHIVYFRY